MHAETPGFGRPTRLALDRGPATTDTMAVAPHSKPMKIFKPKTDNRPLPMIDRLLGGGCPLNGGLRGVGVSIATSSPVKEMQKNNVERTID
jgi:hypothetical protein